jgi:hypothetical protein
VLPFYQCKQGDQIGRILTSWAIVFFGQFYENYTRSAYFELLINTKNVLHYFLQKNVLGYIWGKFFENSSGHTECKQQTSVIIGSFKH